MSKHVCGCVLSLAATVGVCMVVSAAARKDDEEEKKAIKEAQQGIIKVADLLPAKPAAARIQAAALAKKYPLDTVMHAFKQRSKHGIGVGPAAGAIKPDWIERKVYVLGKKPMPADQMKKEAAAVARMAEIIRGIAEVTEHYTPPATPGSVPANWKGYTKEMKQAAQDLTRAARKGNAKSIQNAANDVGAVCAKCHAEFR